MGTELTTMNNSPVVMSTPSPTATLLEMRMDSKKYPRVGSVPMDIAILEMKKIISQAYMYRGQSADARNIEYTAASLVDELLSGYDAGTKAISFAEISRIVKRAILNDQMFGISVASIYKVILEYINGEGLKLCRERDRIKEEQERPQLKGTDLSPMIQAYTGALLKNAKL